MIVAAIPSNRAELCQKAVKAWRETGEFDEIWVMWDSGDIPDGITADRIYTHDPNSPVYDVVPQHSSCCRSWLVYEAWKREDVEWLVHLDDDVVPIHGSWKHEIEREWKADRRWFKPFTSKVPFPRGYPYGIREEIHTPKIVHGIWTGMPDLDALTQIATGEKRDWDLSYEHLVIPYGHYFPMSSMAVAIHRDLFPASYFLWMGWDLPLNKFGDIWCGVILKKICDHFGWLVTSGAPVVYHERASNVWKNLKEECKCIEENEQWWEWVDAIDLSSCSFVSDAYFRIAANMEMPDEPRFDELRQKMLLWQQLFA